MLTVSALRRLVPLVYESETLVAVIKPAGVDTWASSGGSNTKYFHGDLIGSTRSLTSAGSSTSASVYTAFGELVSGTNHRYGYASVLQCQAHAEFPFIHVGHRYYDPGTGRFFQRDPVGITGGVNVYSSMLGGMSVDSFTQTLWQYVRQEAYDNALTIIEDAAAVLGPENAALLKKVVEAAKSLTKWKKQVNKLKPSELRKRLKKLQKTFEEHLEKYKDHPDSKELACMRVQIDHL